MQNLLYAAAEKFVVVSHQNLQFLHVRTLFKEASRRTGVGWKMAADAKNEGQNGIFEA